MSVQLIGVPRGWRVDIHPGRQQPYSVWRAPENIMGRWMVWQFCATEKAAREYIGRQSGLS